ncbi:hypothetical protein [Deinococcus cellulosilyticus]|uniref:Uncharacterized protein n=1 Tax=Deinococcus cellulosilyticus (strain DSM 18568 / NBRC 106333 / KACC 11606 / 5516J-15) TaxID=1223518 RepID=A0A511N9Y1_DEIC1|nr:hypothetical protein [Deinococcus cellulosilyticus]GEM49635.1 hypothetical protein DC3_52700 [Deinococcus cellulosilyticus NBRC 106333 = KACC 11606]
MTEDPKFLVSVKGTGQYRGYSNVYETHASSEKALRVSLESAGFEVLFIKEITSERNAA